VSVSVCVCVSWRKRARFICVCIYICCVCVCMCVCIDTYAHTYVYIHMCIHKLILICVYIHAFVCIYSQVRRQEHQAFITEIARERKALADQRSTLLQQDVDLRQRQEVESIYVLYIQYVVYNM
jgi:hypothetical protein